MRLQCRHKVDGGWWVTNLCQRKHCCKRQNQCRSLREHPKMSFFLLQPPRKTEVKYKINKLIDGWIDKADRSSRSEPIWHTHYIQHTDVPEDLESSSMLSMRVIISRKDGLTVASSSQQACMSSTYSFGSEFSSGIGGLSPSLITDTAIVAPLQR